MGRLSLQFKAHEHIQTRTMTIVHTMLFIFSFSSESWYNSHKLPKSLTVNSRLGIESKSLFFLPNNGLGVEVIFVGYMHMVHVQKVWNTNGPNKTPAGSRPKCMSRLNRLGSGPNLQPIDSLMQNGGSYTLSRKDHNMPVCTIIISSFGPVTRSIFGPWAISSPHSLWTVWWIKMAVTFSLKKRAWVEWDWSMEWWWRQNQRPYRKVDMNFWMSPIIGAWCIRSMALVELWDPLGLNGWMDRDQHVIQGPYF